MRDRIGVFCSGLVLLAALLGTSDHSQAQLPPEITADAYLRQVEQAVASGDSDSAWAVVEKIRALREEHDLDLGADYHFRYAVVADALDMPGEAFASVVQYLSAAGRDGEHYVTALDLMNRVQEAAACEGWDAAGREENLFAGAAPEQVAACLEVGGISLVADDGLTPLHYAAAFSDRPEIVKLLLDAGADVKARGGKDSRTPLHSAAVSTRNPEVISLLLGSGAEPRARLENGNMAVHRAAALNENPEVVRLLTRDGALLEEKGVAASTPLHHAAAYNGNPDVVRLLLESGADLEAELEWGETPTFLAAGNENLEVLQAILAAGGDLAVTVNGATVLHEAAYYNENPEVVEFLVQRGDLTSKDRNGQTALHYAARGNQNLEVLKLLLANGAALDERDGNRLSLMDLAAGGRTSCEVIRFLADSGFDVAGSSSSRSPLARAVSDGRTSGIVDCLVELGANVNEKDYMGTLLHNTVWRDPPDLGSQFARALVEAGANVEERSQMDGETPLHLAAREGNSSVGNVLIEAGANVNARTEDGETPLLLAARRRRDESLTLARELIKAGADVNIRATTEYMDVTALHAALESNQLELAQALIEAGANVNGRARIGEIVSARSTTALHLAAESGSPEVLSALIGAGADIHARDNNGWTPLYHAAGEGPELVRALIAAGASVEDSSLRGAATGHHAETFAILIDAGARLVGGKYSPTELLRRAARYGGPEVVRYLIGSGGNIEPSISDGSCGSPLFHAASNSVENVQVLLNAGAEVNRRTCEDWNRSTPLHAAARSAEPGVVAALLEAGADVQATADDGSTALHDAVPYGSFEDDDERAPVVRALVEAGVPLEGRDARGWTPLHFAAERTGPEVVRVLLEAGADATVSDDQSVTVLEVASSRSERGDNNLVKQLIEDALTRLGVERHEP